MEIDEDVKAFLVESNENLNQLEGDLVALEKAPEDRDLINRIYRTLHTLKGNSGFLGLDILQAVAHAGENLLSRLRDRAILLNAEIISALLQTIDAIKQILTALESVGEEGSDRYDALIATLEGLQQGENSASDSFEIAADASPPELGLEKLGVSDLVSSAIADSSIRVDVDLLNKLMNLVGELVLCRNQILEFTNQKGDTVFADTSQRLDLVTTELQEGVMKTRMQPIKTIWSKFPRVVRDMALSLGKQVRLEMEGGETELDKTLIEAIADPLTHIIRNCVDHGIESPSVRRDRGKIPEGKLLLRAFHESGYVNIEIADDGKGIEASRLKEKAIEKGFLSRDRAMNLSDREALDLVFLPSLSTAETITSLSGRGVGMDVVRTNIERINGTIDIFSQVGKGTSFKLKIPLTLAIIPTLIVTTEGDRYAIPQVSLLELVRLEGIEAEKSVEMVHGAPVYRLRGKLLPLVYLSEALQLQRDRERRYNLAQPWLTTQDIRTATFDDILNIVVLQATDKVFGLVVDAINDTQEIVVKPLGKQLKGIPSFAGATIMGDGRVALILDVQGLAQSANVISETQDSSLSSDLNAKMEQGEDESQMILLFTGPQQRRMAIPLSRVARLEEFPQAQIERIGNQRVIQYRQKILPLIDLSAILGDRGSSSLNGDMIQAIVVAVEEDNAIGFVVEEILDTVSERITIKGQATQIGIQYAAVIQGRVTEAIDVDAIIEAANLQFFSTQTAIAV